MNYEEAVAYIEETPKFTTKNKLEHTKECLRRLGNPQKQFQVVHVAGTNGKGSTCAFLTSVFREAGYSCGLFTSPHLVVINERFQINEKNIDNDTFLRAFEKVKKLADELVAEGSYHPTYFEFLFLMGMVIFADANVDYVILETGLGGRLDATTAVEEPSACVITSISFDHMQYLGNTIEAIAGEKAGIIVPGVPVIYDGNNPAAAGVIRARAQELGSPYFEVKREDTKIIRNTRAGIDFSYENEYYGNTVFTLPFIAEYQVMNSSLALKTIEVLKDQVKIPVEAVRKGLLETRWQGRMETVLPGVIVDGAHNEDAAQKLRMSMERYFPGRRLILILGVFKDKEYEKIASILCPLAQQVYTVDLPNVERTLPAEKLAECAKKYCRQTAAAGRIEDAVEKAMKAAERAGQRTADSEASAADGEPVILACGSLSYLGDVIRLVEKSYGTRTRGTGKEEK